MKQKIGIGVVLVLVVGLIVFASYYMAHKNAADIPADTVGNTAGNLHNQGLFCEYNGLVYFSNAYDGGALYSMKPDCTDLKRLSTASAKYINAGGNFLFYYLNSAKGGTGLGYVRTISGVYRCKLNGKSTICLDDNMATMMTLVGDHLYYQHYDNTNFSSFNKLAADKSSNIVLSKDIIDPACCVNGIIYYSGNTNDHYLYALDTRKDTTSVLWQGNLCYPTVIDDYVYYMDISNNYRLCRYSLSKNSIEVLTNDRIDFYNIYGNVIFYQRSSDTDPALLRMSIDGGTPETVAEGIFNRINTTSVYTYFYPYDQDGVVYRTSTTGPVSVDKFPEASAAALKNTSK